MTEDEINDTLIKLLDRGLIEIEYDENLQALFKITELGKRVALQDINIEDV
jgi:predicted transcriptional regulator